MATPRHSLSPSTPTPHSTSPLFPPNTVSYLTIKVCFPHGNALKLPDDCQMLQRTYARAAKHSSIPRISTRSTGGTLKSRHSSPPSSCPVRPFSLPMIISVFVLMLTSMRTHTARPRVRQLTQQVRGQTI